MGYGAERMSEPDPRDSSSPEPPRRVTRFVQPLGPRVLARIHKDADRLDSGLFLPEGAKDDHAQAVLGQVVEVARTLPKHWKLVGEGQTSAELSNEEALGTNVSGIPMDAMVLFEKDKGVKVPWDETLRLLEVRHILAIVEVIDEQEMQ